MNNSQLISNYYIVHRDELLAFAGSRLGGNSVAEDILHDVFFRLLTTDKMISEETLPALVYTMLRNQITDYYRRRSTMEQYEHYVKGGSSDEATAESVYSVQEVIAYLERGLARLPEKYREVYRLHIYGGMKVSEISQQTGEAYKKVENRLGIARKAMRQYMHRYA